MSDEKKNAPVEEHRQIFYQDGSQRDFKEPGFMASQNNLIRIAKQHYEMLKAENISVNEGQMVLDICKKLVFESKIN